MSAVSAWQNHEHYVHKILSVLGREPARTVITTPNAQLTAEAFAESIFATAAVLRSNDVAPGSTVAILTEPNHHHMLTIRYAAHLLGATTVYIRSNNARSEDDMLPAADQAHMLAEVGAGLLVTDQANIGRGRELCQTLSCTAVVAGLDRLDDPPGGTAGSAGVPFDARYEPGDRLVITYTSGTTDRPKGVCHSYRGWNTMAAGFEAVVRGSSAPTFLAVTPVSQTVGVMVDGTLAAGGSVVLHERFSGEAVLRDFAGLGITDCYLAVPHLYELTAALQLAEQDLSKLRHVIYSGSPAAPHRMAEAARVFGRALLQSYGSTEAGPVTYLGAWEHRKADLLTTVGRPYPGVRLRVCQRDPRRPLPAGRTGEIWVRSSNLMEEYLGDPALTAKVLREGWLRTGDLGRLDDAGYLTLTGRIGEVIKNGGLRNADAQCLHNGRHSGVADEDISKAQHLRQRQVFVHLCIRRQRTEPGRVHPAQHRNYVATQLGERVNAQAVNIRLPVEHGSEAHEDHRLVPGRAPGVAAAGAAGLLLTPAGQAGPDEMDLRAELITVQRKRPRVEDDDRKLRASTDQPVRGQPGPVPGQDGRGSREHLRQAVIGRVEPGLKVAERPARMRQHRGDALDDRHLPASPEGQARPAHRITDDQVRAGLRERPDQLRENRGELTQLSAQRFGDARPGHGSFPVAGGTHADGHAPGAAERAPWVVIDDRHGTGIAGVAGELGGRGVADPVAAPGELGSHRERRIEMPVERRHIKQDVHQRPSLPVRQVR